MVAVHWGARGKVGRSGVGIYTGENAATTGKTGVWQLYGDTESR